MTTLIIRRVLIMIPMLILMSVVIFFVAKMQPGDAFTGQKRPGISADYYNEQRAKLGLDQPIYKQYLTWANNVVHGDLGESIKYKRPIMDLVKERMTNTIMLGTISLIITYLVAFPLGILSGRKPYSLYDYGIQFCELFNPSYPIICCRGLRYLYLRIPTRMVPVLRFGSYRSGARNVTVLFK